MFLGKLSKTHRRLSSFKDQAHARPHHWMSYQTVGDLGSDLVNGMSINSVLPGQRAQKTRAFR